MKKIFMKILALTMIITLFTGSTVSAGLSKPSSTWNLKSSGRYNFSGKANASDLYSNYYFTGKDKFQIHVKNRSSSNSIKVKIYEKGSLFAADSFTVPKTGVLDYTSNGRSSSKTYYLVFYAPCDFEGYIE